MSRDDGNIKPNVFSVIGEFCFADTAPVWSEGAIAAVSLPSFMLTAPSGPVNGD